MTVVFEHYGWYKIILPKDTPAFIRGDLIALTDPETASVIKDRVNIRLNAGDSSPIIGMAEKGRVLKVLGTSGAWYRIEPTDSCFGWIHKQFAKKLALAPRATAPQAVKAAEITRAAEPEIPEPDKPSIDDTVSVTGVINPYGMVFKRTATHKIVTPDKKIFLLKGDKKILNTVTYHKVKVTGKMVLKAGQKYPVIEVTRMEPLD